MNYPNNNVMPQGANTTSQVAPQAGQPAPQKITTNDLPVGGLFYVTGNVTFSKVASRYEGAALTAKIDRDRARGVKNGETRPHTTIEICHAQVLSQSLPGTPENPLDIYAKQKCFMSAAHPEQGPKFSMKKLGDYLPVIFQRQPDGSITQIIPEGELATGLKVTIVSEVFSSKNQQNNGVSIQSVICEEPVRYFTSNSVAAGLESRGIVVNGPVQAQKATPANDAQASPQTPVTTPEGNPYSTQPISPAVPNASPYAQVAPNTQTGFVQPAQMPQPQPTSPQTPQHPVDNPFPTSATAPAPAPAQAGGIAYNPANDPNRGGY